MPEKLYTTGEVAKIFGVSYVAVKKWAYSGKIKYIKTPGGKYRYPESEIQKTPWRTDAERESCHLRKGQLG